MAIRRLNEIVDAPTDTPTVPPGKVPRVRVNVSWTENEGVKVVSTHSPGTLDAISALMPLPAHKTAIGSFIGYYGESANLNDCIWNCRSIIDQKTWARAIASEILLRLGNEGDASIELSCIGHGGYLALNDGVYQLTPIAAAPLTKAMAVIRAKTMEATKTEVVAIKAKAKKDADAILATASKRLAEATIKMAEANRLVASALPSWIALSSTIVRRQGEIWYLGFVINITLTRFDYEYRIADNRKCIKSWNALPQPASRVLCWVPVTDDGSYRERSICVDRGFNYLPHVNHDGSCMSLAAAPSRICNAIDLLRLKEAMQNCHTKVQLNSLYASAVYWDKRMQDAMPEVIKRYVLTGRVDELARETVAADQSVSVTAEQERATTWQNPTP